MSADWPIDSLPELCAFIWDELGRVPDELPHPWRTPGLATVANDGPQVRTVVLRAVGIAERRLYAFSDARAPKARELSADNRAQWLFYDPARRVQLRAHTTVRVHRDDGIARSFWEAVPQANRRNYRSARPPGATVTRLESSREEIPESQPAQFAVLAASVTELDWLWLADGGHRRARFRWVIDSWSGEWLVP